MSNDHAMCGFDDFNRYCAERNVAPGDEPIAFAAWLETLTGQPCDFEQVGGPSKVLYQPHTWLEGCDEQ